MRVSAGFTLIEVMVVVAILGILATIVMTNVIGKDEQARVTTSKASLSSIANALELYKLDKVGYIRFASVYKSFQDVSDFREVIREVEPKQIKRKAAKPDVT